MHLSWIDIAIIIGYMLVLIGIGIYFKAAASKSLEDYFLGGRKMPWFLLSLSSMAAWLDMTGTMVITSFIYLLGPRGLYIEFRGGAGLILIFMMLWLGKWHRRSGAMTGAEWMVYRFGNDKWGHFARLATVVATVVMTVGMLAYSFKGAGLFLAMFLPLSPFQCTMIMTLITAIYTMEAGFYGVIFTDMFQSICIWAGMGFIVIMAVMKIVGTPDFAVLAAGVTGNSDWMATMPKWETTMPAGYENYRLLTLIAGIYLLKSFIQGLGAGADPKYFGAKSDRDCGMLSFGAGWFLMLRWPLMLGFAVLGIFLVHDLFPDQNMLAQSATVIKSHFGNISKSQWPEVIASIMNNPQSQPPELIEGLKSLLGQDWNAKLNLLSYEGTVDPERILPAVILFNLPSGLRGLLIVALLAAAMSTFNALINTAAGFLTRDLYQGYFRRRALNKELIYASYAFSFLLVIAGLATAYSTPSINDIWGWLTVGLIGGLAVPGILRLYWWRFNGGGFAIGTIAGLAAALLQRFFLHQMSEMQQFAYITAIGFIASVIGTFVTEPTDRKTLEHFYRTTRPFGLWGPLKHILSDDIRKAMQREHFYDILSVPFGLTWLITLLLIPMQLMIGAYRDCIYTSAIFAASLVALYFFWYRNLGLTGQEIPVSEPKSVEKILN